MSEKDIDDLLKASLFIKDEPSDELNNKLKLTISKNNIEESELSIWWIPILIAVIFSSIGLLLTILFVSNPIIKFVTLMFIFIVIMSNIILTFTGVKYFGLKKGAVI